MGQAVDDAYAQALGLYHDGYAIDIWAEGDSPNDEPRFTVNPGSNPERLSRLIGGGYFFRPVVYMAEDETAKAGSPVETVLGIARRSGWRIQDSGWDHGDKVYRTRCPLCGKDRRLMVFEHEDGTVGLFDHGGHAIDDILDELGLSLEDLGYGLDPFTRKMHDRFRAKWGGLPSEPGFRAVEHRRRMDYLKWKHRPAVASYLKARALWAARGR